MYDNVPLWRRPSPTSTTASSSTTTDTPVIHTTSDTASDQLHQLDQQQPPPPPAPRPPPPPGECCGKGCTPCVWDIYDRKYTKYVIALEEWQEKYSDTTTAKTVEPAPPHTETITEMATKAATTTTTTTTTPSDPTSTPTTAQTTAKSTISGSGSDLTLNRATSPSDEDWTIVNDNKARHTDETTPLIPPTTTTTTTAAPSSTTTWSDGVNTTGQHKDIRYTDEPRHTTEPAPSTWKIFGIEWKTFLRRYMGALLPLLISIITFAPNLAVQSAWQVAGFIGGFTLLGYWVRIKMGDGQYQCIPEQRRDDL